jgi:hypothetical protein
MRSYSHITLGRKGEHPLVLKDLSRGKNIVGSGAAAVFDVSNETGLRNARNVATSNGESDIIKIHPGTPYTFRMPFSWGSGY